MIRGKKFMVKSSPVKSKPHRAMASSFEVEAMIRGYHQYKAVWDAQVGEQLQCRKEMSNPHDIYAVAILKSGVVVGYIPQKISPICSSFLRHICDPFWENPYKRGHQLLFFFLLTGYTGPEDLDFQV